MRIFYADGHNEILEEDFKKYREKNKKGYKKPLVINNHTLTPLSNTTYKECYWTNLHLFVRTYPYFKEVLDKKHFELSKKLVLKKSL